MKTYIGTKVIRAKSVERLNKEGRDLLENGKEPLKCHTEQGYLVTCDDGYERWLPKDVFERCYREVSENEKQLIKGE